MNPMKPETAVPRMDELMTQFKNVLKALRTETVSHRLAELEREGILVVQELTLVAPRLHEVVMQASRNQRTAIARGLAFGYAPEEEVGKYTKATIGMKQTSASGGLEEKEEAEWKTTEEKPKKKTTRKKKTAKKKEDE